MLKRIPIWIESPIIWCLLALSLFWMTFNLQYSIDKRVKSFSTVINFKSLYTGVVDIQSGVRGYIITGDKNYLDVYYSSKDDVERILLLISNTEKKTISERGRKEKQLLDLMEQDTRKALSISESLIKEKDSGGFEKARTLLITGEGKKIVDRLRRLVERRIFEESLYLMDDTSSVDKNFTIVKYSILLVSVVFFISTGFYVFYYYKDIKTRTV